MLRAVSFFLSVSFYTLFASWWVLFYVGVFEFFANSFRDLKKFNKT